MKHIPSCTIFTGFRKLVSNIPSDARFLPSVGGFRCKTGQDIVVQKIIPVSAVVIRLYPVLGGPKTCRLFLSASLENCCRLLLEKRFMGVELVFFENKDVNLHFGRFETPQRELFPISSYSKLVWLTGVSISGYDPYWCCGGHCIFPSFPRLKFCSLMMKSAPGCQGKISEGFSASQMNLSGWNWITIFWPTWNIFFLVELLHPSKPLILGAHVTSTWRQSSTPLLSLWTRASRLAPTPKNLKSWELDLTGENQSNQFSTETPLQGPYKFTNAYKCRLITFLTSTFLDVTVGFQNLFTMLFCPPVIWQACKLRDTASGRLNWLLNGIFFMNNLLVC